MVVERGNGSSFLFSLLTTAALLSLTHIALHIHLPFLIRCPPSEQAAARCCPLPFRLLCCAGTAENNSSRSSLLSSPLLSLCSACPPLLVRSPLSADPRCTLPLSLPPPPLRPLPAYLPPRLPVNLSPSLLLSLLPLSICRLCSAPPAACAALLTHGPARTLLEIVPTISRAASTSRNCCAPSQTAGAHRRPPPVVCRGCAAAVIPSLLAAPPQLPLKSKVLASECESSGLSYAQDKKRLNKTLKSQLFLRFLAGVPADKPVDSWTPEERLRYALLEQMPRGAFFDELVRFGIDASAASMNSTRACRGELTSREETRGCLRWTTRDTG